MTNEVLPQQKEYTEVSSTLFYNASYGDTLGVYYNVDDTLKNGLTYINNLGDNFNYIYPVKTIDGSQCYAFRLQEGINTFTHAVSLAIVDAITGEVANGIGDYFFRVQVLDLETDNVLAETSIEGRIKPELTPATIADTQTVDIDLTGVRFVYLKYCSSFGGTDYVGVPLYPFWDSLNGSNPTLLSDKPHADGNSGVVPSFSTSSYNSTAWNFSKKTKFTI